MIPTIDISSIAFFAAILKAIHWIIAGARVAGSWFVRVVVGGFIATRFGRALLEFGLFALIYTTFSRALSWLVAIWLGTLVDLSLPDTLRQGMDVLVSLIPFNDICLLFGDALALTVSIKNYRFAYVAYHRISSWLFLFMHTGRV